MTMVPISSPPPITTTMTTVITGGREGGGINIRNFVLEVTKKAQEKGTDPLMWAIQLSSALSSSDVSIPSIEVAHILISHLCWENNVPIAWKYLEKALSVNIAPPMLLLALLSLRVLPNRHVHTTAFRLYLELLKRHAVTFVSQIYGPSSEKILAAVDDVLHLSDIFGIQASEPGVLVVEFVFYIVWQLLDIIVEDEGMQELIPGKLSRWTTKSTDMEIDGENIFDENKTESREKLKEANAALAIELVGWLLQHKFFSSLLCLARQNMSSHWGCFIQRLQLLGAHFSVLKSSAVSFEIQYPSFSCKSISQGSKYSGRQQLGEVITTASFTSSASHCHSTSRSVLWIPLDLFFEDAVDGSQVTTTSAVELLSRLTKSLQAVNKTTWHETFLGLWMAALRFVQRERDPIEAPVPRLESRLCILLSITTLAIADIIEEEETCPGNEMEREIAFQRKGKSLEMSRRKALISSLQVLGDYEGLLTPPHSVMSVANQAAARAMVFTSGISVGSGYFECISMNDIPIKCSGNMRHLIVEACIARNLLDTSAYCWPGYVNGSINQLPHGVPNQVPGWSSLMKGIPLTPSMVNVLSSTPASSLAELEKILEIAANGSVDEKVAAANILCGSSLLQGWNIQEHAVRFALKLLSPPAPPDYSGSDSHLIIYAPMLYTILAGISSVDGVQIFSLQGLVPELAAALMPICEAFGSSVPNKLWTLTSGEDISVHSVFSSAFALLLRLWRFNHPPLEHCLLGDGAPVGSQLTPEYLLLVRNSQVVSCNNMPKKKNGDKKVSASSNAQPLKPIFLDSFPRLKVWYRQHQACIASTLSGLVPGTPVHHIVDVLLNMTFRKINKGGNQSMTGGTSGSSSLSSSSGDDTSLRPKLPAWDILEAVPFVVDAALTACSHGRLSPRELATGLKDLADFLPASLATIVSYFSAEVTRGVWKPAYMNGTDWPSPSANLSVVENHIKKILAATGVDVPSLAAGGSSPATLPLPLAAYVSLTITYKLDKASERFLNLVGPALENLAAGCPWPSMPIVAALWTQKVKRWSDFLILSASRTVFQQNNCAVAQLLKSCFTAVLGLSTTPIINNGGVGSLLGHGFNSHFFGGFPPLAPGIPFLRIYRSIRDLMFVVEEILSLLMFSVKEIAGIVCARERTEKLKKFKHSVRYGHISLSTSMTRVKLVSELGASFVWLSGGPGLVKALFQEVLPSWFLSVNSLEQEGGNGDMVAMLGGHALSYFSFLCGTFAWGTDSSTSASRKRPRIINTHLEFLASAFDGKITVGCDSVTWRAYVTGFLVLIVECAPTWISEVEVDVLKRLSRGLRQWHREDLALSLLGKGGIGTMGAAAELIIRSAQC